MSESLINDLLGQLQGAPMQNMAEQLGTDTATASEAISAALSDPKTTIGAGPDSPLIAQNCENS